MQERVYEKLSEISERLARVETMIHERTDDTRETRETLEHHERRIAELEKHKSSIVNVKDVLTWLVMAGIALWSVIR